MRFPETEAKVAALALSVANGMLKAPEDFPSPPVSPGALRTTYDQYFEVRKKIMFAEAALQALYREKDSVYSEMRQGTKANLRYGEAMTKDRPGKLTGLGWGAPRERKRLQLPGEVRNIAVGRQGQTTLDLSWEPPVDGGKVAAYEVQRKDAKGGKFETIATVAALAIHLENQPRMVELDYQVVAMNRAGRGNGSGVVTVVL